MIKLNIKLQCQVLLIFILLLRFDILRHGLGYTRITYLLQLVLLQRSIRVINAGKPGNVPSAQDAHVQTENVEQSLETRQSAPQVRNDGIRLSNKP